MRGGRRLADEQPDILRVHVLQVSLEVDVLEAADGIQTVVRVPRHHARQNLVPIMTGLRNEHVERRLHEVVQSEPDSLRLLEAFGQVHLSGVPKTELIFCIWSDSLLPGKRGRSVYSSAISAPAAQMSTKQL